MLSLLAGPFTRVLAPGAPALTIFPSLSSSAFGYDDTVGVFNMNASVGFAYSVMQLDGTTDPRAVVYQVEQFIIDFKKGGWLASLLGDSLNVWDLQNGVPAYVPEVTGAPLSLFGIQIRCTDRYLKFTASGGVLTAQTSSLIGTPSWSTEAAAIGTVSSGAVPAVSRLSPSGSSVVVGCASGEIRIYDTIAKRFTLINGLLPANIGAYYSPMLDVYVVLTGTLSAPSVSVYSTVPQPSALSSPSPASALTRGQVTKISATLTGGAGEPCPGELIAWSITAGAGTLSASQSITDSTGTASVLYAAPLTAGTNPTIQAQAVF